MDFVPQLINKLKITKMAVVNVDAIIPSFEDIEFIAPIGLSPLGNLLYDDISFPSGSYKTLDGVVVSYEEFRMQSVEFVVSQSKNIVRTAISGRKGTVKEYNNESDFEIQGTANLNELINVFPADQLLKFRELAKVPQEIPVVSKILNSIFEIDNVILTDFSVTPGTGKGNVSISFRLESDQPFDLKDFEIA